MKPIGPLMKEHRLMERMDNLMAEEQRKIDEENRADPAFIEVAVDFFWTYTDRTHQVKEEDILFKALAEKPLTPEHKRMIDELIDEHALGRKIVGNLADARKRYVQGGLSALKELGESLSGLVKLYEAHIDKEDKHLFYPCMKYFSQKEQDDMLEEFREFDQKLIHQKYQKVIEELEEGETEVQY